MPKGRKPIPNKILELRGGSSHSHRPERKDPDLPAKVPSCPPHLDDDAKREWGRVVNVLKKIGLVTELDRGILAAYCEAYSRWVQATIKIREMGMIFVEGRQVDKEGKVIKPGIPKANPYIKIARDAYDQMVKTGSLFGMSPSSRASLSIQNQAASQATDKTELFRLMKHGGDK